MMDGADRPARVLIVEDEANIALALKTVMGREGWDLSHVADGMEALPAIAAQKPDVVLLDVMLPNVSGYEICQAVRLDPGLSNVRILMMTAKGTQVERRKGLALGADGFISKPFDLRDLLAQVRGLLGSPQPEVPSHG